MKLYQQIRKLKIHGKRLLVIGLVSAMFCGGVNMDEVYAQKSSDAGETKAAGENVRKRDMEYREISYEEELAKAKASIDLGDVSEVTSDLILPQSYGIHVSIQWKSSKESVISSNGRVKNPEESEGDQTVTLTATLSSTMIDDTETVKVDVTVKALSATISSWFASPTHL